MGLFKRTKKKDENIAVTEAVQENTTAKVQEEVVETEEEKAAKEQEALMRQANPMLSTVANEGRRFTLLVEDAKQLEDEQGIQVAGNLYGNIQLGDLVYFILPNNMIMYSRIDGIEIGERKSALAMQADKSRHVVMYPLLRKPLKTLFGDKLSAEGTTVNNGGMSGGAIEDVLIGLEHDGGHIGKNYAAFIRRKMETGLKKFGAMLGDYVEVGCNSVLNPGTMLGRRASVYPTSCVRGTVPEDCIFKAPGKIVKRV